MIRYLTHELIDKQQWDACMRQSPGGLIFGCSWFLDAAYPHWSAVVMGDYEAVLVLPVKRKMKLLYAFQPFFTRHLGIYSRRALTEAEILSMLEHIPSTLRWVKILTYPPGIPLPRPWQEHARRYQQLNLEQPANFSSNTKRNIKKAEKAGLSFHASSQPELVVEMFRHFKGAELEVFSDADYTRLLAVMKACIAYDTGQTYVVSDPHGNRLASAFFCHFGSTVTFLKGAVSDEGRNTGAMHFLFSQAIAHYAGTYARLDFGGSNVDSVARFYQSFGSHDVTYSLLERNTLPALVRWIKK